MGGEPDADLGVLATLLARRLVAEEEPILREAGVAMWEYIVLDRLSLGPATSQAELAARTRRDSTRLIRHLDALQERGLIERSAATPDRRHNRIALTEAGRVLHARVKEEIRAMEERMLSALPVARRAALRDDLARLVARDPH